MPATTDVLCPTVAASQRVPFIELLLPSRYLPARLVSAGLQHTTNATAGKNQMPKCLLDASLAKVYSASRELWALLCCVFIVVPDRLA